MQPIQGIKLTALGEQLAGEEFEQLADRNLHGDLEPNDSSRMHILREALNGGRVWDEDSGNARFSPELELVATQSQVFVVRHNWAAVLAGAIAEADEIRLPYELCAFEFKLRGSPAILFAYQVQQQGPISWRVAWEVANHPVRLWRVGQDSGLAADLVKLLSQQVRAICVALDAQIATSAVVAAPEALNRKRERNNRSPCWPTTSSIWIEKAVGQAAQLLKPKIVSFDSTFAVVTGVTSTQARFGSTGASSATRILAGWTRSTGSKRRRLRPQTAWWALTLGGKEKRPATPFSHLLERLGPIRRGLKLRVEK